MERVGAGEADVAAIDCVSFALATRVRPDLVAPLRVLTYGPSVPALPYVTSSRRSKAEITRIKRALIDAVADPDAVGRARRAFDRRA